MRARGSGYGTAIFSMPGSRRRMLWNNSEWISYRAFSAVLCNMLQGINMHVQVYVHVCNELGRLAHCGKYAAGIFAP